MPLNLEKPEGVVVLFSDDLQTAENFDCHNLPIHRRIAQSQYMSQPITKRIDWIESITHTSNNGQLVIVATNDYYFIRLLGFFCDKDKFTIYHCDNDTTVHRFVDLKPNPALALGELVFRISVREALKQEIPLSEMSLNM